MGARKGLVLISGGRSRRWKAPRVRRIPFFFAEARVMRPLAPSCVVQRESMRKRDLRGAARPGPAGSYPSRGWGSRGGIVEGAAL